MFINKNCQNFPAAAVCGLMQVRAGHDLKKKELTALEIHILRIMGGLAEPRHRAESEGRPARMMICYSDGGPLGQTKTHAAGTLSQLQVPSRMVGNRKLGSLPGLTRGPARPLR